MKLKMIVAAILSTAALSASANPAGGFVSPHVASTPMAVSVTVVAGNMVAGQAATTTTPAAQKAMGGFVNQPTQSISASTKAKLGGFAGQ